MKFQVLQTMSFQIRIPDCSKLAVNRKNENVNVISGSRVMKIFLYKRLTRIPEILNTPV